MLQMRELLPKEIKFLLKFKVLQINQVAVNPPAMIDGEVRAVLFKIAQAITTQAQAIRAQANREVVPHENQHASSVASCVRDLTRINHVIFLR